MKEIIAPIERGKIEAELTPERFLRHTNKGGNDIYVVNYKNAPNTMQEIGRLREIAFRAAGGGTGKEVDIDMYDTMEEPCQQLIVWDTDAKEILGGYRFILGENIKYDADGRRVYNPSALPWERNNFKGAFEMKSENGFGFRIEVQQGNDRPFP